MDEKSGTDLHHPWYMFYIDMELGKSGVEYEVSQFESPLQQLEGNIGQKHVKLLSGLGTLVPLFLPTTRGKSMVTYGSFSSCPVPDALKLGGLKEKLWSTLFLAFHPSKLCSTNRKQNPSKKWQHKHNQCEATTPISAASPPRSAL